MSTFIADDHSAINARLEEIKSERLRAPAEYEMQTKPAKEPANQTYMGWDIYAPYTASFGFATGDIVKINGVRHILEVVETDPNADHVIHCIPK